MKFSIRILIILSLLLLNSQRSVAQTSDTIQWISFTQLNDSLKVKPKKVFVDFYANWCSVCKEMDRTTFRDNRVIKILNEHYYAVKMNVESKDTIVFGNQIFLNKRHKRINPIHEIALLLGSRQEKPFSLPVLITFNDSFTATARYFQFLDANAMIEMLLKE